MSEERLNAIEKALAELAATGGASITVSDPRLNNLTRWIATLMGSVALVVMIWVASSINRLNETMSRVVTQNEAILGVQQDHSERLKDLERRNGR